MRRYFMTKILFLLLSIFLVQISGLGQELGKIKKLFPHELIVLKPGSNYAKDLHQVKFDSSQTKKGDTIGAHNDLEYLLFNDVVFDKNDPEILKLLRVDWVSNVEYDAFCEWVLDSLYREKIYANRNPTGNNAFFHETISRLLLHDAYYKDINGNDSARFDPSKTKVNRKLYYFDYDFDWRKKLRFYGYYPIISEFIRSPYETIDKGETLDERKWLFRRSISDSEPILVARDREVWASKSDHPFDYAYNLANHYYRNPTYKNDPVQGIEGNQAKAFLLYLEQQYQKKINEKGIPYRVHLTLPDGEDLTEAFPNYAAEKPSFETKELNMTEHWQITNQDYKEFLDAICDSLFREVIYSNYNPTGKNLLEDEIIGEMLSHPDVYFDRTNVEWKEFDPSQPNINRDLFPFDYDFKWRKKIHRETYLALLSSFFKGERLTEIDMKQFILAKYTYKYHWEDLKRKANPGDFVWNEEHQFYTPRNRSDLFWNYRNKDMGNGIRRPEDYAKYIIREVVSAYPGINCLQCNRICEHQHGNFKSTEDYMERCGKCPESDSSLMNVPTYDFETNPDALVEGLTYQQAIAFYHWKYVKSTKNGDFETIIYNELFPNQMEFEKVQRGKQVIRRSEKIDYPTPFFRYIIHLYKK